MQSLFRMFQCFNQFNALCFSPFIAFDNVRSSFTKRQDMFPVILALCFVLQIFRCSEHYAPKHSIGCLPAPLQKQAFQIKAGCSIHRFGSYLGSYPWKVH